MIRGLTYERGSGLGLSVYPAAKYTEKTDNRRYGSRYHPRKLRVVSWGSSTRNIVTLSTTEAEYVVLGDGVREVFMKSVLSYVVPSLSEKYFEVFIDNEKGPSFCPKKNLARQRPSTSTCGSVSLDSW